MTSPSRPWAVPMTSSLLSMPVPRGHEVARCSTSPSDDVTTRCRADDLSLLPRLAYVVVTGSSRTGPVRFLDAVLSTKLIGGGGSWE